MTTTPTRLDKLHAAIDKQLTYLVELNRPTGNLVVDGAHSPWFDVEHFAAMHAKNTRAQGSAEKRILEDVRARLVELEAAGVVRSWAAVHGTRFMRPSRVNLYRPVELEKLIQAAQPARAAWVAQTS